MLPTSLGQVGVVGQATEQGGYHGAGVHLLLWREGSIVRTLGPRGGDRELDGRRLGDMWTRKANH